MLLICLKLTIFLITSVTRRLTKLKDVFSQNILGSFILFGFAILGVLPNTARLWSTYEFSKETIRGGKSELTDEKQQQSSGLNLDYAMAWSYGKFGVIYG